MNQAQREREFEKAAKAVAKALMTQKASKNTIQPEVNYEHLMSRLSTFQMLLSDARDNFQARRGRSEALNLVLIADFCWQTLRTLCQRPGNDRQWMNETLPPDWEQSDADCGDNYYRCQRDMVENAKWIYDLHTAMRHPHIAHGDLVALLRDPVDDAMGERLLLASRGISQVWLAVQSRIDPLVL